MNKHFTRMVFFSLCLAALLLVLSPTPKSSAAALAPNHQLRGGGCTPPSNPGISSNANAYATLSIFPDVSIGQFRFAGSDTPSIGSFQCTEDPDHLYLVVDASRAESYNVQITVNGMTTTRTNQIPYTLFGHKTIFLDSIPAHQQYAIKDQSCTRYWWWTFCSAWSPTLMVTTAQNPQCQDGYVWRQATVFDQVCVTPLEQAQVANDNSQAATRIDPSGAYGPQSCVSGYVWREAFGGDQVCVTPSERSQVANDNSQALTHIIQF